MEPWELLDGMEVCAITVLLSLYHRHRPIGAISSHHQIRHGTITPCYHHRTPFPWRNLVGGRWEQMPSVALIAHVR